MTPPPPNCSKSPPFSGSLINRVLRAYCRPCRISWSRPKFVFRRNSQHKFRHKNVCSPKRVSNGKVVILSGAWAAIPSGFLITTSEFFNCLTPITTIGSWYSTDCRCGESDRTKCSLLYCREKKKEEKKKTCSTVLSLHCTWRSNSVLALILGYSIISDWVASKAGYPTMHGHTLLQRELDLINGLYCPSIVVFKRRPSPSPSKFLLKIIPIKKQNKKLIQFFFFFLPLDGVEMFV